MCKVREREISQVKLTVHVYDSTVLFRDRDKERQRDTSRWAIIICIYPTIGMFIYTHIYRERARERGRFEFVDRERGREGGRERERERDRISRNPP